MLKIAHRGAKAYAPENTLMAFQKAIDMNVDGIELDVHLCKTGELIVIHDATVNRTTNGKGFVAALSLEEIKKLRIDSQFEIPTLDEVLKLVNKKCFVNIELKGQGTTKPVIASIESQVNKNQWRYSDFLVSSFDWEALKEIHLLNPKIPLGVLIDTNLELAFAFAKEIQVQSINAYYPLLTKETVVKIQKEGFQVFAWTVNEIEAIQKIKLLNTDGIISDFPDRL